MPHIEIEIWGATPFHETIMNDSVAHAVLLAVRSESKAVSQIARECALASDEVEKKASELERLELLSRAPRAHGEWIASIPIYLKSDLALAEEIGGRYAATEAEILRSALPEARGVYETCDVSKRFPWDRMSLVVIGALIGDFAVYDRVRFLTRYRDERLLPPVHRDGRRWSCGAFEKLQPRYPGKARAFYQNHDDGPDALSQFGYNQERRRKPPNGFRFVSNRKAIMRLSRGPLALHELASVAEVDGTTLSQALYDWQNADPAAVTLQDGRYILEVPVFSSRDLMRMVSYSDTVAEIIHKRVTVPSLNERIEAAAVRGLRFPVPDGFLARDIALQRLIEDGLLARPPDPPVPWNFGVWGWEGRLPIWDEQV